ncbi:hypothetical protein CLOM_g12070 [Closterium sp. NIES-68]|nr:hypothetical protein CLOM_g12070 [Closterium sp. NIES-68]GJP57959.1 hypothetical protein CLOP_g19875 [Closterium sp. NIES-67]GJP79429.1 hypothetical protein CLOP_g9666 [Closterium sp. NIES-67]
MERWTADETRALIALRERVERETRRSINAKGGAAAGSDDDEEDGGAVDFGGMRMWEWVASEMRKQGFQRSMVQCKAKWTVLFNRYKSMELSERRGKACPFFDELTAIFKIRAEQAAREAALGHGVVDPRPPGLAGAGAEGTSLFGEDGLYGLQEEDGEGEDGGEDEEEEEEEEDGEGEDGEEEGEDGDAVGKKRRRGRAGKAGRGGGRGAGSRAADAGLPHTRVDTRGDAEKEALRRKKGEGGVSIKVDRKRVEKMAEVQRAFLAHQVKVEGMWGEEAERVEARGRERGEEWIGGLEERERKRLAEDVKWREEEEQRAQRAEAREVECDAMLQALLAQLLHA